MLLKRHRYLSRSRAKLRELKIADQTIAEINNSELFKFSPYKNLNFEQLKVVTDIIENNFVGMVIVQQLVNFSSLI